MLRSFSIEETLKAQGYKLAHQGDKVDAAIINTCSVTSNADQKQTTYP